MHLSIGIISIYDINNEKSNNIILTRIKSMFETILFAILILIGVIIFIYGNSILNLLKLTLNIEFENIYLYNILARIVFFFAIFIMLLFVYFFILKKRYKLKSFVFGAIFGSISINIISLIFSEYLNIFKGFSIIYGSLTTLILIMMWIYSCFFAIFLGAEMNRNLTNIK